LSEGLLEGLRAFASLREDVQLDVRSFASVILAIQEREIRMTAG
jgi:hypothetical protein